MHAHKLVLALSSPTFAAMFKAGAMAEGAHERLARVPMDLFDADVFRIGLRYLYTGQLPLLEPGASDEPGASAAAAASAAASVVSVGPEGVLRPDSQGVGRLLELLRLADYLELNHLKQVRFRPIPSDAF